MNESEVRSPLMILAHPEWNCEHLSCQVQHHLGNGLLKPNKGWVSASAKLMKHCDLTENVVFRFLGCFYFGMQPIYTLDAIQI